MLSGSHIGAGLAVCAAVALLAATAWSAAAGAWPATALALCVAAALALAARAPGALLGAWVALEPWLSHSLRYPSARSLVTFDRVVVVAVVLGLLARRVRRGGAVEPPSAFELSWAGYATVGAASALALSTDRGAALRVAVDAFALPLLLYVALRRGFDRREDARALFWGALAVAATLPMPGVVELLTGVDLFTYPGGAIVRADVLRPNGPFANDVSYAVVSSVVAVTLWQAPRRLGLDVRGLARHVWRAAIAAALLAALLPMFRTVVVALVAAFAVPYLFEARVRTLARAAVVAALVCVAAAPLVAIAASTHTFQNRVTDPSSVFSRLATLRAGAGIVADHPLAGVGLTSYRAYFDAKHGAEWDVGVEHVAGVGAANSPHNNLLGVWAELGIGGLFFYLLAASSAVAESWRRRNGFALAILAVYAVPGLTLQHGIYGEVNLYSFCALGMALGREGES